MRFLNRKTIIAAVATVSTVVFCASCSADPGTGQQSESKTQQSNYDALVKKQPAHTMPYSVTRDTINFWIDTWKNPDALSYTYLVSGGKPYAFVVGKGLPVSYCTSLTPNYKLIDPGGSSDNGDITVNAPSVDGVYYSGGDCQRYYVRDATTNDYVEFTAGADTTLVTRTQPLPLNLYADALPLGDTTAQQAQALAK